ncbi:Hypothetical predicted protein [Olea europaea subsp. europaea]|uniref:Uncharacterized protein n=1 Tax=Olea europaea subsp. europaea TaxID=158383 RepID=A0A8S0U696_OLEEU|nr:Hypothetical predicted protein [Olea europaea subsp. europaea]
MLATVGPLTGGIDRCCGTSNDTITVVRNSRPYLLAAVLYIVTLEKSITVGDTIVAALFCGYTIR